MNPPNPIPKKFQTRTGITRRSKEEREAFERAENERRQQRLAEAARNPAAGGAAAAAAAAAARGRGGGAGRGRGGIENQRTRGDDTGGVFGPAIPGISRVRGGGGGLARYGGLRGVVGKSEAVDGDKAQDGDSKRGLLEGVEGEGRGGGKRTSSGQGKVSSSSRKDDAIELSSDEGAEEGPKRDIEEIWISSGDEEQQPVSSKGKRPASRAPRQGIGLRPVRAPREARERYADGVVQPAKKGGGAHARKGKGKEQHVHEDGAVGASTQGEVYVLDGDPMEDVDGGLSDVSDVDDGGLVGDEQAKVKPSTSPEVKAKVSRRRGSNIKDSKIASETIEERAERARYNEDVRKLREELTAMPPAEAPTESDEMSEQDRLDLAAQNPRNGRLYLFQFPPLTPMLVDPTQTGEMGQDPPEGGHGDVTQHGASSELAAAGGHDKSTHIKKEEGALPAGEVKSGGGGQIKSSSATATATATAAAADMLTADGARLPGGMVGKLHVHQSGRVTLDWGGTSLEVKWGSEVDFLQDAVLACGGGGGAAAAAAGEEGGEEGEEQKEQPTAYALSQVRNKMVVIPDWQKMYE